LGSVQIPEGKDFVVRVIIWNHFAVDYQVGKIVLFKVLLQKLQEFAELPVLILEVS